MIGDYFNFCPAGVQELIYPLLQTGKLFFDSPCQLRTLIMAIGIDCTDLSPGAAGG